MAIFHCNISVASRAVGASAVAGAAYISRSAIEFEREGTMFDFTKAHRHERLVADLGIALPDNAPKRFGERGDLTWPGRSGRRGGRPRARLAGREPKERATWNAVCLADFGDSGAAFVALPQIPPRNVNWFSQGKWEIGRAHV